MDKNILDKLEDINTELSCILDALAFMERGIAEQEEQQNKVGWSASDAVYSIRKHMERISSDLDDCVWSLMHK